LAYRPHPKRARTNSRYPQAWATSDSSGFVGNHIDMAWQYDYNGTQLFNKRILRFRDELDTPQQQFRALVLPPDPVPIMNARPEPYSIDEAGPVTTQITVDAVQGDATLFVQAVTGLATSQPIIVYLDNGGFWSVTITGLGVDSIGISVPLPSSCSVNQIVSAVG
jgi:hypothetical protein